MRRGVAEARFLPFFDDFSQSALYPDSTKWTDCNECPSKDVFPRCATSEESCACQWDEWLNSKVEEIANE